MTKEERKLWYGLLKNLPYVVKRQETIGNYIVDFYCAKTKTAIELDGSQHYETDGAESDKARDAYLSRLGITVLRYSNADINRNFEGVCEDVMRRFGLIE